MHVAFLLEPFELGRVAQLLDIPWRRVWKRSGLAAQSDRDR